MAMFILEKDNRKRLVQDLRRLADAVESGKEVISSAHMEVKLEHEQEYQFFPEEPSIVGRRIKIELLFGRESSS